MAGTYCQYKATDDCSDPELATPEMPFYANGVNNTDSRYNDGGGFCVNGGTCYTTTGVDFFCYCDPYSDIAWTGLHCDVKVALPPALHATTTPPTVLMIAESIPPTAANFTAAPTILIPTMSPTADPTGLGTFVPCGFLECR